MSPPETCPLDQAAFGAWRDLSQREVPQPDALLLAATGLGLLPARMQQARRLPLASVPGVPQAWRESLLHWGQLDGLRLWMVEDEPEPLDELERAPWTRPFPVWLAAAAGAATLLTTHAVCALSDLEPGTLALASDHLDLSGASPLVGLGESRLGPMFPDQTRLHDAHLRRDALRLARKLGLEAREAVFACTPAPALETPAEQRWYRTAGADVSVQGLAPVLLAAAHAGLGALAIGVVVARAAERLDIARVAAAARALAPALDDLLWEVASAAEGGARTALDQEPP